MSIDAKTDLKYIWHPCAQMKDYEELPPIIIDSARGTKLYGADGKCYLDVVSSWWCNLLGHCNPRLNSALKAQVDKLEHVIFSNFTHAPAIELCEKLSALLPAGLKKFFFTDNGSSAIEAALKMSFQYQLQSGQSQRTRFMTLTDAYHGETLGALGVGGENVYSKLFMPLLMNTLRVQAPDCYRCPCKKQRGACNCECFCFAERAFAEQGDKTVAFVIEPLVQAAAGMRIYPAQYLKKLRKLCDQYDVLLIADEIAVGYGRTGKMFACEHAGITPDIMCISKGLTGGYMPMALAVTTQQIYDAFYGDYSTGKAFLHSHTYCGNPLAAAVAVEVLRIFDDEDVLGNAATNAAYLSNLLTDHVAKLSHVGEIRNINLINGIELVQDVMHKTPFPPEKRIGYQVYKQALSSGVVLRCLDDVLYFNPPLTITQDEIALAVTVCKNSIQKVLG